jgi:hypothetical protein
LKRAAAIDRDLGTVRTLARDPDLWASNQTSLATSFVQYPRLDRPLARLFWLFSQTGWSLSRVTTVSAAS